MDADRVCSICHEEVLADADGENAPVYMPCAHLFHADCLGQYANIRGITDLVHLPCPNCRTSGPGQQELIEVPEDEVKPTIFVIPHNHDR